MDFLDELIRKIGGLMWGPPAFPALLLLIGGGIYFTVRLHGLQFSRFFYAVKYIALGAGRKDKSQDKSGEISPFQALMTSLAAAVGNGNIVGVATAIAMGGPGAIFWMWVSAVVGMATKFGEVLLSVHYRKTNPDDTVLGGPMVSMRVGISWKRLGKVLAGFFAFAMAIKALFSTSMVQSNSISDAIKTQFGIDAWISGVILAFLTWMVIVGGIKSIGRIAEVVAPFMSLVYIAAGVSIMALYWNVIPGMIADIISQAFQGTEPIVGGFAGSSMAHALRFGVERGAYSNEAGIGSAAVAHASAKTDQPVRQGLIAMMDVFMDTIVICSITAFVILLSPIGEWKAGLTGAELAWEAFESNIPLGGWIVVLSSLLFGYSSMITWPYFGEQAAAYLFGIKIKKYYRYTFCILVIFGSLLKVNTVWIMGGVLNGLMAIPNLIGLFALSGVIISLTKAYFKNQHGGQNL